MRRGFTIHHNGPLAKCVGKPHDRCKAFWQAVVLFHTLEPPKGKGWSSVAYSWGVCPHGERFEGAGWDSRQFANGFDDVGSNEGDDREWFTVLVFLGWDEDTGLEEEPTPEMVAAVADLIEEGRDDGHCGDRVTPHNFWKRKRCPGDFFTKKAAEWDNRPITLSEEDDMALFETVADFKAAVREAVGAEFTETGDATRTAILDLARRGARHGHHELVIPTDFVQGGTVYWTDFAGKVAFPQGSGLHSEIKARLAADGLPTSARRVPQVVLDAIPDEAPAEPAG